MILGVSSTTRTAGEIYDAASSILAQKLSQIEGVGQVMVGGGALPAVRVELNPTQLNAAGISLEQVRGALAAANANRPKGEIANDTQASVISTTDQLLKAKEYRPLIIAYHNGAAVVLSDVAQVIDSVENVRTAGMIDAKPAVLVIINRQPGANIIDTVDRIYATLPALHASIPADMTDGRNGPHHYHPGLGARRRIHHADFHFVGNHGGVPLSAKRARHSDSRPRGADFAGRHLWRHVPVRLQHRQSIVDGVNDLDRVRGRRRDRGDRKYLALPRGGLYALSGGSAWHP
jgi:hypothetical protein